MSRTTSEAAPRPGWRTLACGVAALVRAWWRTDRIRASPGEGRRLRLQPGEVTILDGEAVEVVRRTVVATAEGVRVMYEGRTSSGVIRFDARAEAGGICRGGR